MSEMPLSLSNICVSLGGRQVLTDVTLSVDSGELVGLIGPNGAGKTTVLRTILRILTPRSGTVTTSQPPRNIGYVPQRHEFSWDWPLSVRDAVMAALTSRMGLLRRPRLDAQRAVEKALFRTDMTHLANRVVAELSGGQKQRVLVARALALNPDLLLLDEPFTGLDMPTQELLQDLFNGLAHDGCAVLMTTHDLVAARAHCDRLLLLNGTIIADGSPQSPALNTPDVWVRTFNIRPDNPLLDALGVA